VVLDEIKYNAKLVLDADGNGHLVATGKFEIGDSINVDYYSLMQGGGDLVTTNSVDGNKLLVPVANKTACECKRV
jgi:hypothetical protein